MVYTQLFDLCKRIVELVWGKSDIEIFCSWDQWEICFSRPCRVSPFHVNHPSGYSWDLTFLCIEHSRNSLDIPGCSKCWGDTQIGCFLSNRIFHFREQTKKPRLFLFLLTLCFLSEIFPGNSWALFSEGSESGKHSPGTLAWGALRQWSRSCSSDCWLWVLFSQVHTSFLPLSHLHYNTDKDLSTL